MESFHEKLLFGESLAVSLPNDAIDISQIREIPDNQEVFAHSHTDQSMIFEILEFVEEPHQQAIRTHFEDLCLSNDVCEGDAEVITVEQLSSERISMEHSECVWYLSGKQKVAKFNESVKNAVQIHMALFRLPQFTADVLLTFNDPSEISSESSSHASVPVSAQPWTEQQFKVAVDSLKIINTDIFG